MPALFSNTNHRPQQPVRRKIQNNNNNSNNGISKKCSISLIIVYSMVGMMFLYVTSMILLTRYTTTTTTSDIQNQLRMGSNNLNNLLSSQKEQVLKHYYGRDEWGDRNHPYKANKDWGDGVQPQKINIPNYNNNNIENNENNNNNDGEEEEDRAEAIRRHDKITNHERNEDGRPPLPPDQVLTAYLEPIDQDLWTTKPLPVRTWTSEDLKKITFPTLNSCSRLPELWPVDDYPDDDPFLPWIHDVFPTHDGTAIQFVAQNKQRCRTGTTSEEKEIMRHMKPQVALFQHVAVKRINETTSSTSTSTSSSSTRYRLSSHEDADLDGMHTRFICKFKPSGEETLSEYNFSYEYASYRKNSKVMFHEDKGDNKLIHTSQLTFTCPVPPSLQSMIRTGESVVNDYATIFVDLIPIRTPPRYGPPNQFLPPYYKEFLTPEESQFHADIEWGKNHILPKIEDSGRWENIPVCRPSLLEYGKPSELEKVHGNAISQDVVKTTYTNNGMDGPIGTTTHVIEPVKTHRLASCIWASTGYATRGNRFAINDGQRRLLEWIEHNRNIGVEHFYLYDNSGAFNTDISLQPIADLFPNDVTVIKWPSKVCNNNPNNVDSVGERSSQYAAEASCRLRFGPHVDWIAQFDIDEYLVPMGTLTSIHTLLDKLEDEGNKIVSFGSWRAWPRRRFIETPVRMSGAKFCGRNQDCFNLQIPMNFTMLQAYNCDRQKPGQKESKMPAEKQLYRPDYVMHHFIHYSTVTKNSILNREDTEKLGRKFMRNPFPDPLSRFGDEVKEALMLHTKAVATQDTVFWETACNATYTGGALCRLGTPFPLNMTGVDLSKGDEGWKMNCYVNHKIEDYWVKLLDSKLRQHVPEIAERMAKEEEQQQQQQLQKK